ncbi:MAG: undecaprenyl/decaprenyl-phosphate alpha-N-acetylglucosaminyl 1-phosphate transferase [Bacteroidetes bacterium]|nr:undecaprenyl/decaprenyl-phosphate alpha-N-acetylglucosaminyl 1-phosphate transferase [Bacteroidota bacterium]
MNALILALVFVTSFIVVLYATPPLIKVAILKRLFDEPGNERKIHKRIVPTIGGIIIFAATLFSYALWFELNFFSPQNTTSNIPLAYSYFTDFKLIIATMLMLFFVGIKDDIIGTAPIKKLIAQMLTALILVLVGNIRITGLHGVFEVNEIPYWASVFLSLFTFIVVINAFNLIDGIDGLAAGIGFIGCMAFGIWFVLAGSSALASLAFALGGSLLGFLVFNFSPAKIFMGDSGSLTIGLILSVLAIKLIEFPVDKLTGIMPYLSKPVFVIAVLMYPLADTLRVFTLRALAGTSPFSADRNHLHHRLLDLGFGHRKIVFFIYLFNIICIGLVVACYPLNANLALVFVVLFALLSVGVLLLAGKSKHHKRESF